MKKTAIIFDENGEQYLANDLDKLFDSIDENGAKAIYQSTYFNHDLLCGINKLVELGMIEQVEGSPYPQDEGQEGLDRMKQCIIDRHGEEKFDKWQKEIDDYIEETNKEQIN